VRLVKQNRSPFLPLTIVYYPVETIDSPDHWKIRWYHYADIIRENIRAFLDKHTPHPAIWETVVSHAVLG
jgi:hypothetical protein